MKKSGERDVLVDLCIQREYLTLNGHPPCRNASQVTLNVKHLMAFARLTKVPVVSCVDVNGGNRIGAEFVSIATRAAPQEQKAAFTLLPRHTVVESDNSLCMPLDILKRHQQVIFTKIHRDPFTNPKFDRLLTEMIAQRFVVFGIPLETSLRILVLGLLRRRRRVTLLTDACGYWNREAAEMVLRQLGVKGCLLTSTNHYIADALRRIARQLRLRLRASREVA